MGFGYSINFDVLPCNGIKKLCFSLLMFVIIFWRKIWFDPDHPKLLFFDT